MKRSVIVLVALGCALAAAQDAKDPKANLADNGGSAETEAAVTSALHWLARHQAKDGHWGPTSYGNHCDPDGTCTGTGLDDFKVGVTSLAALAFLQAGYLPDSKVVWSDAVTGKDVKVGKVVAKSLDWLIAQQGGDGAIGPRVGEMMYNHLFAARALCEALRRTKDEDTFKEPAQKAIDFINSAQNFGLGWRYTPKCGNNDTSITGGCILALRSAKLAKLKVHKTCFEGALAWIDRVTDGNGQVGYDRLGSGEIYVPGKNEQWMHHPTMTAVGMLCRTIIEKKEGADILVKGAKILAADLPEWDKGDRPKIDYYYWYYGTNAMFEASGPTSKRWKKWNEAVTTALLEHQKHKGCKAGSWDSDATDRWAYAGGRVYATALNALTLEVYYAHERVFDQEK